MQKDRRDFVQNKMRSIAKTIRKERRRPTKNGMKRKNNDPITKLQHQMDGVTSYYRKNSLIIIINVKEKY